MDEIRTWTYKDYSGEKIYKLFPDRLSELRSYNGNEFETVYSFDKLFERKYILANPKIDYDIFKEVIKLKKPEFMSIEAEKKWDFWTHYDNSTIEEIEIFAHGFYYLYRGKYGFAELYKNTRTKKEDKYHWQRPDDFFFHGPNLYGVDQDFRVILKYEILEILQKKGSKLTHNDGFLIFDYSKIKKIDFVKDEGNRGIYFRVIDGKVIVGGWENPRDGGENYSSVEHLWYNTESRIPKEFHDKIQYVIDALDEAIVHE